MFVFFLFLSRSLDMPCWLAEIWSCLKRPESIRSIRHLVHTKRCQYFQGYSVLSKMFIRYLIQASRSLIFGDVHNHLDQMGSWTFWFCLFLIFILYWSIVDLRYCVSFRYTAKGFSHIHIHISILFEIIFPYRFITKYWVEFPVLYSRSLIICFTCSTMCILIPNS